MKKFDEAQHARLIEVNCTVVNCAAMNKSGRNTYKQEKIQFLKKSGEKGDKQKNRWGFFVYNETCRHSKGLFKI